MLTMLYWNGRGLEEVRDPAALPALLGRNEGMLWVDLDVPTEEDYRILPDVFRFHPLAIEDCRAEVHHPKIDDYGDYFYMIFHNVAVVDLSREAFRTKELDIFVGPRYVVTHHREHRRSLASLQDRCRQRPDLLARGSDFLLHEILDAVVERYFPALEMLERELDRVEDRIFSDPTHGTLNDILKLKRDLLYLRRIAGPQKEVVNRLTRREFRLISDAALPFFRDIYDQLFRIHDLTEQYRDVITGAMEAYLSVMSNRMNEIMKLLTAVSTIILPLSLIASIYGMNFKRMPELDEPWGYPAVLFVMLSLGLGMYVAFKRKRWI